MLHTLTYNIVDRSSDNVNSIRVRLHRTKVLPNVNWTSAGTPIGIINSYLTDENGGQMVLTQFPSWPEGEQCEEKLYGEVKEVPWLAAATKTLDQ